MEKKKTGISYVFQLAKDERKKLHLGMFLSVISAALSLVPYFVVYKILLMIFQKNISYTEILMWAGIGITSAVLQAILMSFAGILSHTAAFNTMHRIKLKVVILDSFKSMPPEKLKHCCLMMWIELKIFWLIALWN